jgi:hypothetical protein
MKDNLARWGQRRLPANCFASFNATGCQQQDGKKETMVVIWGNKALRQGCKTDNHKITQDSFSKTKMKQKEKT